MRQHLVWIVALILIAACGGSAPEETAPAEPAAPAAEPAAPAPSAPAAADLEGNATEGKTQFIAYCSACHGPDAKGVKGLGKDLTVSTFVAEKTDGELLEYVKRGRDVNDPLNTTGVPMPPKGGNPALSDPEIANIIAFIRTIHE